MTEISAPSDTRAGRPMATRLAALTVNRPWVRGYLLMSPTLVIVGLMMILPLVVLVLASFWTQDGFQIDRTPTLRNYAALVELTDDPVALPPPPIPFASVIFGQDVFYPFASHLPWFLLVKSILISSMVTILVILVAYPVAYFLAFHVTRWKTLWLIVITIPFWTSYLLRVFSWKIMLGFQGPVNAVLMNLGLIDQPLDMLYQPSSVIVTLVHAWSAFAILPIYVSLQKIDRSYLEAATDLGDRPWTVFRRVTLPLSMPGVIAASLLVFMPTVGDYVTPTLLGGNAGMMIGNHIQSLFQKQNDWPLGAAVSLLMMLSITLIVTLFLWATGYRRMKARAA